MRVWIFSFLKTSKTAFSVAQFCRFRSPKRQRSSIKKFRGKKSKIFNFELQKCYVPQKKAQTMQNSDSARKSMISFRKIIFFRIFTNFASKFCWTPIIQRKSVFCQVNPTEIEHKFTFHKVGHLQSPKVKSTLPSTCDLKCAMIPNHVSPQFQNNRGACQHLKSL